MTQKTYHMTATTPNPPKKTQRNERWTQTPPPEENPQNHQFFGEFPRHFGEFQVKIIYSLHSCSN